MKTDVRTEAFDLMQYFYRTAHEPLIRCLIRFSGRLDPDCLRRAVDLSILAVPQLGCRFSERTHSWESCGYTAEQIVHEREGDGDAERLLLDSIDFSSEPQLKLHLLHGAKADTLCAVVGHQICDGAGFRQYLYLLAGLYSRCTEHEGCVMPPEPGDRGFGQLFRARGLRERLSILKAPAHFPAQDDSMLLPLPKEDGEPFTVLRRIGAERFAELKDYAKARGATVNDLLLAAYARAHHAATHSAEFAVPCPVDLRKYLPPEAGCGVCNLSAEYVCRLSVGNRPFDATLRAVSAQMNEQKQSDACLKGPLLLEGLHRVLPYPALRRIFFRAFHIPVVSYTNLGVLEEEKLDFRGLEVADAYMAAAVKHPPYFQVSVSTFAGRCTLSASLAGSQDCRAAAERFLDRLLGELRPLHAGRIKGGAAGKTSAGGGSRAEGQPAGRQEEPREKSQRADARHKGKSKPKPERKKTVRQKQ